MKPLLICVLLLIAGPMVSTANVDAAKFTVTYSIRFNEVTLYEAARLEKVIKEKFGDACAVTVDIRKISNVGIGVDLGIPLDIEGATENDLITIPWGQHMQLDTTTRIQTLELHW